MKRKSVKFISLAALSISLAACGQNGSTTSSTQSIPNSNSASADFSSAESIDLGDGKSHSITKGGYYTASGTLADGQILINTTEEVFLQLDNAAISNRNGPAIQVDAAKQLTISAKEGTENTLADGGSSELNAVIFSNDDLSIEGSGSLTISAENANGIESDDDITINGSNLGITAVNNGINANNTVTINDGNINIEQAVEGVESEKDIVINGGTVSVTASDDGINAAEGITINGGDVYSSATKGDGIDSNGTIDINGGKVVAIGAEVPEAGLDADQNEFNISGGTVIAAGGTNSSPSEGTSSQPSVLLGGVKQSEALRVTSESGDEVLTFNDQAQYSSVLISSPDLVKGKSYSIYIGGALTGGDDFHGLSLGGDYAGGTLAESFTVDSNVTTVGEVPAMGGPNGQMPMDPGKMQINPDQIPRNGAENQ